MDDPNFDLLSHLDPAGKHEPAQQLEAALRRAARRTRPVFSDALHERILAAVEHCEMLPAPSRWARFRRPLALAASLLAIMAGGYWASGWRESGELPSRSAALDPQADTTQLLASNNSELMQRALAAADHWDWLDEDAQTAASWFIGELPLAVDSGDGRMLDDEEDPSLGS
jgi:hypothetical protein